MNQSSLRQMMLIHQQYNIFQYINLKVLYVLTIFSCRPVAEQAGRGAHRVHQLLQLGEAAALPQHHQEHPRQHLLPPVAGLPGHQQEPAELPPLLRLPTPAPAMPGGPQQQAGLLARGGRRDEQVDGAGRVLQRDRPPACPNRRPCQPTIPPSTKESSSRGDLFKLINIQIEQFEGNLFFTQIPVELTYLQLTFLDLAANRLSCLPVELRFMVTLVELYLEENPLTCPPANLCGRGRVHIFKYLEIQVGN